MRISEEYLGRHKLQTKVFPHIQNGTIITRFKESGRISWLVTKVRWEHEPQYHPGKYYIDTMKPYDIRGRSGFFRSVHERETIFWDQYHDRIEHWIKNVDKDSVVRGEKEVSLVALEIFLHCSDSQLADISNIDEKVFPAIDPTKSLDDRYAAFQELRKTILHSERSSLGRHWHSEFDHGIIRNYIHWLADSAAK